VTERWGGAIHIAGIAESVERRGSGNPCIVELTFILTSPLRKTRGCGDGGGYCAEKVRAENDGDVRARLGRVGRVYPMSG